MAEMTPDLPPAETFATIPDRHKPTPSLPNGTEYCEWDAHLWPCDAIQAFDQLAAQRERAERAEAELTETKQVLAAHEKYCDLIVLRPIRQARAARSGEGEAS